MIALSSNGRISLKSSFLIILGIILLLNGCTKGLEVVNIEIRISDFAFDPDTIIIPTNKEIHLSLINDGVVRHQIQIFRGSNSLWDNNPITVRASGTEGFVVLNDNQIGLKGYGVVLLAGAKGTLIFSIPETKIGKWEIGCFTNNGVHFDYYGMKGNVIVVSSD